MSILRQGLQDLGDLLLKDAHHSGRSQPLQPPWQGPDPRKKLRLYRHAQCNPLLLHFLLGDMLTPQHLQGVLQLVPFQLNLPQPSRSQISHRLPRGSGLLQQPLRMPTGIPSGLDDSIQLRRRRRPRLPPRLGWACWRLVVHSYLGTPVNYCPQTTYKSRPNRSPNRFLKDSFFFLTTFLVLDFFCSCFFGAPYNFSHF